jgi:CheY-like chemotaxis protein
MLGFNKRTPGVSKTVAARRRLRAAAKALALTMADCRGAEPRQGKMGGGDVEGMCILVAEDEFLVALVVEETLQSLGCTVLGPFSDLAEASAAAESEPIDAAVLDINLGGEMVYPLAEHLDRHGIPFVFTTGYAVADLPERFRAFDFLRKPIDAWRLKRAVHQMLN